MTTDLDHVDQPSRFRFALLVFREAQLLVQVIPRLRSQVSPSSAPPLSNPHLAHQLELTLAWASESPSLVCSASVWMIVPVCPPLPPLLLPRLGPPPRPRAPPWLLPPRPANLLNLLPTAPATRRSQQWSCDAPSASFVRQGDPGQAVGRWADEKGEPCWPTNSLPSPEITRQTNALREAL